MIRLGIIGTVSAIALTVSANAADLYRAPAGGGLKDAPYVATWTGFYAGVNGGYAWSQSSDQLAYVDPNYPFYGLSPEGGFGGGQIGYNLQGFVHPNLVLGIEADIQGSDISDSGVDSATYKYSSKVDWFGTVRGRLGYAIDSALVYATGGFAYGGIKNDYDARHLGAGEFKFDGNATGYVVGGGVEYKLAPAWSLKAEYQYINLGKNNPVDTSTGQHYTDLEGTKLEDDAFHTVRVGLNYHFGHSYESLK
ncbi:outer membrane protein [Rhodomicrobium vannielii ATCC 17100]|uniref:Outer membrane protein n=1 Tax=Rhodomicrobium vannielii (strain ATCC 17100 / DSM 162 / LMG 4299 / NCIMB 10020 / ATH 3.1.1) TaxID=648757 RepID=E3HZK8_RHOVT|nr:outer membrane protein [Rhodomicrobium vannielii]ADP71043.1 outer membrane protein [Rhodomicrobium vannielii ATCC 17100]